MRIVHNQDLTPLPKTASVTVKGFIQAPPPAPSGTSIGVPFESANPNASLTPLPQPGVQLAAAINPGMPWMMTYRDDANP
jgi:hypothetical protein